MGQEFSLLRDFALIMVVAGAVTLLFHRLRQPPVLGYLLAGLLLGRYFLPAVAVTDVTTIGLLADIGLVLLLFGVGLEFSWSRIRQMGLAVLVIGAVEILTMISLGYGIGRALGWPRTDALFLGAALNISSSAIIVKVLRDAGRMELLSSRVIVGILVVEDLAAVVIIAFLSATATTGASNLGDIGSLVLRLLVFLVASLTFGALLVPRIMALADRFKSGEVFLITGLALCFSLALISKYLGLSVAAGAFLMGALVGDTKQAQQVTRVMTPVRDMFGALFFISIGMLTDVGQFRSFIGPAIVISVVFVFGKILANTLASFMSGYSGRTSLQVGMGMPQMGEFSLAIARVGMQEAVVAAPLYPVVTVATILSSFSLPYITRSADPVADFLARSSPPLMKEYFTNLADWLRALRNALSRKSETATVLKKSATGILTNLLVLLVVFGVGSFSLQFVGTISRYLPVRPDIVALIIGFLVLVLSLPAVFLAWRNLRSLVDEASKGILRRRPANRAWGFEALTAVLRDSIVVVLAALFTLWLIPFISQLLFVGSIALAVPAILLAIIVYLVFRSVRRIHNRLHQSVSQVVLGEAQTDGPNVDRQTTTHEDFGSS